MKINLSKKWGLSLHINPAGLLAVMWVVLLIAAIGNLGWSIATADGAEFQMEPALPLDGPFSSKQVLNELTRRPESPKNIYYKNACVQVSSQYGGSGVVFRKVGQYAFVVTNKHVTAQATTATAIWPNLNYRDTGEIIATNEHDDLSIFIVKLPLNRHQDFPVLTSLCAHHKLRAGTKMEVLGYGANRMHRRDLTLRGFVPDADDGWNPSAPHKDISLTTQVSVSGDSGGAIVAILQTPHGPRPFLAGINWGYSYTTQGCGYARFHRYVIKTKLFDRIKERGGRREGREGKGGFFKRIFGKRGGCDGFDCPVDYDSPGSGGGNGDGVTELPDELLPVEKDPPAPDAPDAAPDTPKLYPDPATLKFDEDAFFRRVEILITTKLEEHSHPLSPVTKAGTYHFVLLSRANQQFSPTIEQTRQVYSGIKVAPLPSFPIGPIPQMVEYVDSIPVHVYKGSKAVNSMLYDIYKGRYPK